MKSKCFTLAKVLCLSLLCIIVTACGFRLRGEYDFPPQLKNIYVVSDSTDDLPLTLALRQALANAHMTLSSTQTTASYILRINKASTNSSLQSSSTTGQINTYNITYNVSFTLTTQSGQVILPDQGVQSSTQFTMGSNQLLTSFNQDANYTQELQQAVVNQILFRLSSKNMRQMLNENNDRPLS